MSTCSPVASAKPRASLLINLSNRGPRPLVLRRPTSNYEGNILNIADIFERNYNTWDNARIQPQLDAQPDIVVLQFGENLVNGDPGQLASALDSLLTELKNTSNQTFS